MALVPKEDVALGLKVISTVATGLYTGKKLSSPHVLLSATIRETERGKKERKKEIGVAGRNLIEFLNEKW